MIAAGAAAMAAGCSDASRFSEDPFSDPFKVSSSQLDRAPTGSLAKPRVESAPIQSRPLAPLPSSQTASAPPAASRPPISQAPAMSARAGSSEHWSAEGGTPIVVAQGESAKLIASRYGVPTEALLRSNGLASAQQVQPGSRIVIPVFQAVAARPASVPAKLAVAETHKLEKKQIAKAPSSRTAEVEAAARKSNQKRAETRAAVKPSHAEVQAEEPKARATPPKERPKFAKAEELVEKRSSKIAAAESAAEQPRKQDKTATSSIRRQEEKLVAAAELAHPEFRWPARGRIIQGFSGANDGINISVPAGTQVKAAENGVVAYAGNELKGYGNLVLIRHPNGFVTAYAHNGQLEVKRGDQVKRGQTIAKSGQSGNVGSPQLHFELRKGSTPVDPTNYLAGL
jgi:murein DD-endopeptidase MepM/ murein hydrolase activator NlpD